MQKTMPEIVGVLVSELEALSSEERLRVVRASLTLLGDGFKSFDADKSAEMPAALNGIAESELPRRAANWAKQNSITSEQLWNVFHDTGEIVEIICAAIPGKSNREKVRNAYVLVGVSHFIKSDESQFEDKEARAVCERFGFFDGTNHMKYMKGGNEFAGSKEKGWSLTAPGLKRAAMLIAELPQG